MLTFSGQNFVVNSDLLKSCVADFISLISINNSICINLKVVYGKSEYVKTRYMFSENHFKSDIINQH